MSKTVELEVKPEGSAGRVLAIPLSSTGSDDKAKTYEVRDEKGETLLKVDAGDGKTTLGPLLGSVRLPVYADESERDAALPAPVYGMLVFVLDSDKLQLYGGAGWINVYAGL